MKKIIVILFFVFFITFIAKPQSDDNPKCKPGTGLVYELISIATNVLQDEDDSLFTENISPEAYLINDKKSESIFNVLADPLSKEKFIEDEKMNIGSVHMWTPDSEDNAYVVLQRTNIDGTKTNWHSILFKLNSNKKWQIFSWHKS